MSNPYGHPEYLPHHWHIIHKEQELQENHGTYANETLILIFLILFSSWTGTYVNQCCRVR